MRPVKTVFHTRGFWAQASVLPDGSIPVIGGSGNTVGVVLPLPGRRRGQEEQNGNASLISVLPQLYAAASVAVTRGTGKTLDDLENVLEKIEGEPGPLEMLGRTLDEANFHEAVERVLRDHEKGRRDIDVAFAMLKETYLKHKNNLP